MKRLTLILTAALLAIVPFLPARAATSRDTKKSLAAQAYRAKAIYIRGKKAFYTKKFDLSGLPRYVPGPPLTGWIRIFGNNYLADGRLGELWQEGFAKYQPEIRISYYLPTPAEALAALVFHQADLVMTHRASFYDLLLFERTTDYDPIRITAVTGSFNVPGWQNSIAIWVNAANPIKGITLQQLDGVFGSAREGGWSGTNWRRDRARGPDKNIRTWGQLGLTGKWANKPIDVYGFSLRYSTAVEFSNDVLAGSDQWNGTIHAYGNYLKPNGKLYLESDQITDALKKDPYGIGYNRFHHEVPGLRTIPVSAGPGKPYVSDTLDTLQNRTYPIRNDFYFYVAVKPGTPMNPMVKEFLRYVLSQQGQKAVEEDGKYLPLTAEVVKKQLAKLQ